MHSQEVQANLNGKKRMCAARVTTGTESYDCWHHQQRLSSLYVPHFKASLACDNICYSVLSDLVDFLLSFGSYPFFPLSG